VPIEPISLAIGIASFFSTCIECFDYCKPAQSLAENLKIPLVKLDNEKIRLLIWGNAVGILKVDDKERHGSFETLRKWKTLENVLIKSKRH
jgi:hypothetical protein